MSAQNDGGVRELLDEFFGFLANQTEFYNGPIESSRKLILEKFDKFGPNVVDAAKKRQELDNDEGVMNAGHGADFAKYRWTQTLSQVDVCVPSAGPLKASDVVVVVRKRHLKVAFKQQDVIINSQLSNDVRVKDYEWDLKDGDVVITLPKVNQTEWWDRLLTRDPVLDTSRFDSEPPASNNDDEDDLYSVVDKSRIVEKLLRCFKRKRAVSCKDDGFRERKRLALSNINVFPDVPSSAEVTSEEKALRNPLVLSRIANLLSMDDLLNCRVVSSKWKELFDNILCLEKRFKMTFEYDSKYKAHFLKSRWDYTTTTIDLLNQRLEQVKTFPCVWFHFVHGNLGGAPVSQFLRLYGRNIKKLGVSLYASHNENGYTKLSTFTKVLVKHAPNIEYLHIEQIPYDWEKLCAYQSFCVLEGVKLPNLRVFKFSRQIQIHLEFLKKMLTAAVNLQRFETGNDSNSLSISDADILVGLGKINLVRHLEMHSVNPGMILFYEDLARAQPMLSRVSLCFNYSNCNDPHMSSDNRAKLSKALTSIFESSRRTLVDLTLDFPFALFLGFRLPVMDHLEVLTVETKMSTDKNINPILFPKGLDLARTFPVLQRFIVELCNGTSLQTLMPVVGQSLTVRRLEISALHDPNGLMTLSEMFPSVERLYLMKVKEFSKVGKGIWRYFRMIKHLQLEVLVGYGYSRNSFPLVDATLTGFSESTCRTLKDNPTKILDVEKERKDVSILDLKDLVHLTIIFSDSACRTGTSCNLLTAVAGKFAFDMKPGLFVKVGCHAKDKAHQQSMKESLEMMSPYVNKRIADGH